jgi:hypothetical protein
LVWKLDWTGWTGLEGRLCSAQSSTLDSSLPSLLSLLSLSLCIAIAAQLSSLHLSLSLSDRDVLQPCNVIIEDRIRSEQKTTVQMRREETRIEVGFAFSKIDVSL